MSITTAFSFHRHQLVRRHGRGEHAVIPAGDLEALREHLDEAAVGVDHREPVCLWLWSREAGGGTSAKLQVGRDCRGRPCGNA